MRTDKLALRLFVVVSVVMVCEGLRRRVGEVVGGDEGGSSGDSVRRRRYFGRKRTRLGYSRKIVHRTSSVSTSMSTTSNATLEKLQEIHDMGKNGVGRREKDGADEAVVKVERGSKLDVEMDEHYTGPCTPRTIDDDTMVEERRQKTEEDKLAAHRKRLRALLSPEARRLTRPVVTTTTAAPPEEVTEHPGGFQCPNTTDADRAWRAFSSPSSCRLYYICIDGQEPRKHGCSEGNVFNEKTQVCDEPHSVTGCEDFYQKKARNEDDREDKGIGDEGLDPDKRKQYFVEFVDMLRQSGIFKRGLIDLLSKMMAT